MPKNSSLFLLGIPALTPSSTPPVADIATLFTPSVDIAITWKHTGYECLEVDLQVCVKLSTFPSLPPTPWSEGREIKSKGDGEENQWAGKEKKTNFRRFDSWSRSKWWYLITKTIFYAILTMSTVWFISIVTFFDSITQKLIKII